jgi:acetyl-CoA carboxylase carboxyl transferase subunit alpha
VVGGFGTFDGMPALVVGHQKGRSTKEKVLRNFGQPKPEGYRKAQRLMELAARSRRPIICLIDTQGAYPGIDAEERGQAEAIAKNLEVMAGLPVRSCARSSARAARAARSRSASRTGS